LIRALAGNSIVRLRPTEEGRMGSWTWWTSLFSQGSPAAPSTRRLDGRSKTLLAASIKALPHETPGWITNKEAKQLFSSMADEYAFGEMDEVGKSNIADFAAQVTPGCSFEFMPVEGRVYFIRKADGGAGRG
jgi:hypothetical protein